MKQVTMTEKSTNIVNAYDKTTVKEMPPKRRKKKARVARPISTDSVVEQNPVENARVAVAASKSSTLEGGTESETRLLLASEPLESRSTLEAQKNHQSAGHAWNLHLPKEYESMLPGVGEVSEATPVVTLSRSLEARALAVVAAKIKTAKWKYIGSGLKIQPTFKRLNAFYITLERFGFEECDIHKIMKANLGYSVENMLEWACLNVPHERLPAGFTDKSPLKENLRELKCVVPTTVESGTDHTVPEVGKDKPLKNMKEYKKQKEDDEIPSDDLKRLILESYAYEEENGEESVTALVKPLSIVDKIEAAKAAGKEKRAEREKRRREREAIDDKLPQANRTCVLSEQAGGRVEKAQRLPNDDSPEADEDVFLGDFFECAEANEVEVTMPTQWGRSWHEDLSINASWSGQTPMNLLAQKIRKISTKPQYSITNVNDIGGMGYRATLILQAGRQSVDAVFVETDKPCQSKVDCKNLCATKALYALFKNKSLHLQLPEPFRRMWLTWVKADAEEKEVKHKAAHAHKVRFVEDLLSELESPAVLDPGFHQELLGQGNKSVQNRNSSTQRNAGVFADAQQKFERRVTSKDYLRREKLRMELPIMSYIPEIVEAVTRHSAIVITGETGCGKSTQVPHMLIKHFAQTAGSVSSRGQIICAQPRRISATSIARRVSTEMGDSNAGGFCGYSIRGESKQSKDTLLLYCTTGVLLRRLQSDPMLNSVSVVIVDEVHERTMQSDFLLISLRNLLNIRREDFCVVLMSATMDSKKVSSYFYGAPVIDVPGRSFPVSVMYLEDVVEASNYVIAEDDQSAGQVHRSKESTMVKINMARNTKRGDMLYRLQNDIDEITLSGLDLSKYSERTCITVARLDTSKVNCELIERVLYWLDNAQESKYAGIEGAILVFLPGIGEISILQDALLGTRTFSNPNKYLIVALHSTLSVEEQTRAFSIPRKGIRKIVLSTNIAETGVTIPDVVFVIDTCLVKEMHYNDHTRIRGLVQRYIPKSSGKQRQGRAGRVREGFCIRLITRSRFDAFSDESIPELLRVPLDELCLNIIVRGASPEEYLSDALDPPKQIAVEAAMKTLLEVGAIMNDDDDAGSRFKVLPLGHHLSNLPADVRVGKMIILSSLLGCVDPVTTIAAALGYKSPFTNDQGKTTFSGKHEVSDLLAMAEAYKQWNMLSGNRHRWCKKHFLSGATLNTMKQMKREFLNFLKVSGFEISDSNSEKPNVILAALAGGLWPNVAMAEVIQGGLNIHVNTRPVHFHPSSIFYNKPLTTNTKISLLIYHDLVKTSRYFLRDVSLVSPEAILLFCGNAGDARISYGRRELVMNEWIRIHVASKPGLLLLHLRQLLSNFLHSKFFNPSLSDRDEKEQFMNLILDILDESVP